jgi:hypothetical protein
VSVVRLIVATRSSGPQASQPVIKEMPGSVASVTHCIIHCNYGRESSNIDLCLEGVRAGIKRNRGTKASNKGKGYSTSYSSPQLTYILARDRSQASANQTGY